MGRKMFGRNKKKKAAAPVADPAAPPFAGLSDQLGVAPAAPAAPLTDGTAEAKMFNPFNAPGRIKAEIPKFNQMQARNAQLGIQDPTGQPNTNTLATEEAPPVPGQPPRPNRQFRNPMAPVPSAPPAPDLSAPKPVTAPIAPPPAPTPPPAPVQQQHAPGTPAPGTPAPGTPAPAAPAAPAATGTTLSPEDEFKKTQTSLYQNK